MMCLLLNLGLGIYLNKAQSSLPKCVLLKVWPCFIVRLYDSLCWRSNSLFLSLLTDCSKSVSHLFFIFINISHCFFIFIVSVGYNALLSMLTEPMILHQNMYLITLFLVQKIDVRSDDVLPVCPNFHSLWRKDIMGNSDVATASSSFFFFFCLNDFQFY